MAEEQTTRKAALTRLLCLSALAVVLAGLLLVYHFTLPGPTKPATAGAQSVGPVRRIALVQSYWNNYQWTFEIDIGVLEALGLPPETAAHDPTVVDGLGFRKTCFRRKGKPFELLTIYLDTKRRPDDAWKQEAGTRAVELLREFGPAVAILADDNAQRYVGTRIAGQVPIVFCGVNAEYTEYYRKGENVTGFHERQSYRESLRLLSALCPDVRRVVFLTDKTPTSRPEVERIRKTKLRLPLLAARQCADFEDYKAEVLSYQDAPAVALAIFNLNFGETTQEEAIAWTMAHSRIPEVTFQRNTVEGGLLCASIVSAREHGWRSVASCLRILSGTEARSIPVAVPPKGADNVNTVRARQLGRKVPVELRRKVHLVPFATALHWNADGKAGKGRDQ